MVKLHSPRTFIYYLCISLITLQPLIGSAATKLKVGMIRMIRNGQTFGVINFDRIPGYALTNATYRTVENVNVITCISECRKNRDCHSLNFHKKSGSSTLCELNELDRYAADSELAFQKQENCDHYEIKSACKGVICHNGAKCVSDHKKGTWKCRCSVHFAGKNCEKKNPYAGMISYKAGIIKNELFLVEGNYNHATAKNVCKAFGAGQASRSDIGRIAKEAEFGACSAAWTKEGNLGYPEYNGNCHSGSTHTGYYSSSCCSNRVTTLRGAWCLKKNINFCEPGWHCSRKRCHLFRDGDLGTMEEAKKKCAAKNAFLGKVRFHLPSFKPFIQRVCPDCRSMYVGAEKVDDKWRWQFDSSEMKSVLWGDGEPRSENTCVEYNTELHVLNTLPCDTPRGYMCTYNWF